MLLQHFSDKVISVTEDLVNLFYPRVCTGCDSHLMKHEGNLCLVCQHGLPKTYFWDYEVNPVEKLFWGKIPVQSACSFLHFEKDGVVQELMHRFKYEGKTGIGVELGKMFAIILKEKGWFLDVDVILPIPLHATKEARRGYNQSNFIADGMAEVFQVPARSNVLKRVVASESQTRKSRFDRSENVKSVFEVVLPKTVKGKNVLLVDDVVTTGATLEAVGAQLASAGVQKLYVATLAVA